MRETTETRRRRHGWLTAAFLAALLVTGFFAVRFVAAWIYWSDPAQRDATLEPWMTPRFVVHSWHVPPEIIAAELGLPQDGSGRRITLGEVAAARGMTFEELAAEIEAAITAYRAKE